jgi:ABC-type branched-subunit amino acid transport system substrate-binding protein
LRLSPPSTLRAAAICLTLATGLLTAHPFARGVTASAFLAQEATTTAAVNLTPQEKRGKQIYVHGTTAVGREVLAYVGDASIEVPGSALPCANCHGLDGQGKPEGGIVPSNLSWEALTKPYEVTQASGRKRPPYTERALELAITRGLDPGGNKLHPAMPRYQMAHEDMADLVAYLKRVGLDRDPGLTEKSITVGTIVPVKGELAAVGQAIRASLTAYFDEVNSRGGIYNRRVELKFIETADTPAATAANLRRALQDEQVFALAGAFTAGADREIAALADEMGMPVIGPLTLSPQTARPLNRQVFYLLSGLEGQARALVNYASQKSQGDKSGVLVVYPESELSAGVVEAVKDQCQKNGCGTVETYGYQRAQFDAQALAGKLGKTGKQVVIFLGAGDEAVALMREADKLNWSPAVYLTGAGGSGIMDAPLSFNRKIYLAFPTSPADQTEEGVREFRALATKYNLPRTHLATQLSAQGAAKILVEALKRAGKDVSREKLIETLEGLNQFATGLTPAVTYGPNRRIGASGAYVVTIDLEKKEFSSASDWVNVN